MPPYKRIIVLLFALSACLIFIGMLIYSRLIETYSVDFCQNFATIYAGVCGGFCAMFVGILTILSTVFERKKESIEQHIPEFYMPLKYDIANADFVRFKSKTEKGKLIKYYFQNTDKVAFTIDSIELYNEKNECSNYSNGPKYYVSKGQLFCAKFCFEGSAVKAKVFVHSADNLPYTYDVDLKTREITKKDEAKA